ncbi:TPA: LamG domain-containing protein [Candidatus Poribacteria bacterium]|nr:LamG domain-containing protein [Candidatus Poribacteria bacterium]
MKNIINILIIVSVLVVSLLFVNSSLAKIDLKTVVGLWLFDENTGTIAKDSSGNNNHGTLKGNVKWVTGKFGSAVEFPGADANYIEVPDSNTLDMNKQMTVMFWVKTSKAMKDMWADRQVVVGKHYLEYEIGMYMQAQIHTYTKNPAGAADAYDEGIMASFAGKLPTKEAEWELNKWYHVAWTLNGKHEVAYVNGVKIGEFDKANEGTKPGTHTLDIGRRQGGGLPLTGAVDEVAILNVALDEADIKTASEKSLNATVLTAVMPTGKLTTTWANIKK